MPPSNPPLVRTPSAWYSPGSDRGGSRHWRDTWNGTPSTRTARKTAGHEASVALRIVGTLVALSLALSAIPGPSSLPAHADSEEACGATGPAFRPQGLLSAWQRKLGHHEAVRILAIGSSSTEGAPVTVVSAGIGGGDLATRQVGANEAMAEAGRTADASAVRR